MLSLNKVDYLDHGKIYIVAYWPLGVDVAGLRSLFSVECNLVSFCCSFIYLYISKKKLFLFFQSSII